MSGRFVVRGEGLEWRLVDEEIVILDLRTTRYLSLNPSGVRLWPLLVAGASREQLVDELVDAYAIDVDAAGRDVDDLLAQLDAVDLLAAP